MVRVFYIDPKKLIGDPEKNKIEYFGQFKYSYNYQQLKQSDYEEIENIENKNLDVISIDSKPLSIINKRELHKRSSSEPKLNIDDEDSTFCYHTLNRNICFQNNGLKSIQNGKTGTTRTSKFNKNDDENLENEDDDNDSPFNELFFTLFKKELIDYLNKNYKEKQQ